MKNDDLLKALRAIAEESWASRNEPVLLSVLPKLLSDRLSGDYRETLGSRSLKSFIKESGEKNGFYLIEHPTQRAKLGIAPVGAGYKFPSDDSIMPTVDEISDQDVNGFVRILETLTPEEIGRVSFPASFLVRLLSKK